ncbi:DUF6197 family protein [Streptomyces mirabilis]|uniref:DUF6197 family protein n=1 Tax=Streptomyces mirabilis TaxID=68239 RepID=UPI00367ED03A
MTTLTPVQASPPTTAPVELDLDARMALTLAEMDGRCTTAVMAVDINSAHIAVEIPEITAPVPLTPTLAPSPYSTPIAGLLHRARNRIEADGWCTGALRDEQGARCLIGAIRIEASSRGQADDACVLLLDAIRRDFPTAETVPSWNDNQRDPRLPARYLDRAAQLAHARNL